MSMLLLWTFLREVSRFGCKAIYTVFLLFAYKPSFILYHIFSFNLLFGSTNLALVAVLNLTKNPDRAVIFYFLAVDLNLGVNFELKWQF